MSLIDGGNGRFPAGERYRRFVRRRQRTARAWTALLFLATTVGIVVLSALLLNILNDTIGYVAYENAVAIETLVGRQAGELGPAGSEARGGAAAVGADEARLTTLEAAELAAILKQHLRPGRLKSLEKDGPVVELPVARLRQLVIDEVVRPEVVASWSLFESLTRREEIQAWAAQRPGMHLAFRSWLNRRFLTSPQSSKPLQAGIRTAILGSLWVTGIAFALAVPVGVGAGIYLEEYGSGNWLARLIETNINNLAGVPSIIYGMLGLGFFVRALEPLTSGAVFGLVDPTTANGRTVLSGGLTLGLLILPLVIINAREAIRAVPQEFREASFGVGATKWQTIRSHVLPSALPGILTGVILSVSRAFGETAPLIVVGVSTYVVVDPASPFVRYTTLPAQIYQWVSRPQREFVHLSAAAIVVLLVLLLTLNATAIALRNRSYRRF